LTDHTTSKKVGKVEGDSPTQRDFSLATDLTVIAVVIGLSAVGAIATQWLAGGQISIAETAGLGITYLVVGTAVLGWLLTIISRLRPEHSVLRNYMDRLIDDEKPWGLAHVAGFGMGLAVLGGFFALAVAASAGIALIWIVPTLVWLSVLHDVPVWDAISYALYMAEGRPEYTGPSGFNTDPRTVGFFLFTAAGWAVILVALALVASPVLLTIHVRRRRAEQRWWDEYRREHNLP
jgi:hypothetical protein